MVGASKDGSDVGSAYVFVRSASTWTEQQKIAATDGATNDNFGEALSLHGDTALVGAKGDDDFGEASGSAYVFARSASIWVEQQKLVASDGATSDFFGEAVSLNGDAALVGARGDDDFGASSGSAAARRSCTTTRSGPARTIQRWKLESVSSSG